MFPHKRGYHTVNKKCYKVKDRGAYYNKGAKSLVTNATKRREYHTYFGNCWPTTKRWLVQDLNLLHCTNKGKLSGANIFNKKEKNLTLINGPLQYKHCSNGNGSNWIHEYSFWVKSFSLNPWSVIKTSKSLEGWEAKHYSIKRRPLQELTKKFWACTLTIHT